MKNLNSIFLITALVLINTLGLTINLSAQLIDDGNTQTVNPIGTGQRTGGAQTGSIPSNSNYNSIRFILRGADGGNAKAGACQRFGGEGATTEAVFMVGNGANELKPGGQIRFLVGKHGTNGDVGGTDGNGGGGGGGTAILYRPSTSGSWTILAAASGGGGAYQGNILGNCVDSQKGQGGRATENGGDGGNNSGSGGTNGDGAGDGGGGGAFSDGDVHGGDKGMSLGGAGGYSFNHGGYGFGGGGAGGGSGSSGGGGGGYSGGGGGGNVDNGGGGGSYVHPSYPISSSKTAGVDGMANSQNGYVDYTYIHTYIVWTGNVDTDWNNSNNWSPNRVPKVADFVDINAATNDPEITSSTIANAKVVRVFSGGILSIVGTLNLHPLNTNGIFNEGTVFNTGGTINISRYDNQANYDGIRNVGGVVNNASGGVINIDGVDRYGIWNTSGATFNVSSSSTTNIGLNDQIGDDGIFNESGCTFSNNGTLYVRNTVDRGISNGGSFVNGVLGNIFIDQIGTNGIHNDSGTLENNGTIKIGTIATISGNGIQNHASLSNNSGATFIIDQCDYGIFNSNGNFTNQSLIKIGENGALANSAILNAQVGNSVFLNSSCSAIIHIFDEEIIDVANSFTNSGIILQEVAGSSNINSNNGIIFYNAGTFTVDTGNTPVSVNGNISGRKLWTACSNSTDWENVQNWYPNIVPTASDEVVIHLMTNNPVISAATTAQTKYLYVEDGASLTNNGSLTVNDGSFNIESGATVGGNGNYNLKGVFGIYGGTFNAGTSTVTMTGTEGKSIGNDPVTFYNLVIDKPSGINVWAMGNIFVTNELQMLSGRLNLLYNDLELTSNGTIIGESPDSYIYGGLGGKVKKTIDLNAPTSENPGNIGVDITSTANLGSTTIKRGHQAQDVNGEVSIVRYYDITPANNSGLDATVRFHYLDHELNGIAENDLAPFRFNGTAWDEYTVSANDVSANWVETTNVDAFSIWTLASSTSALPVELISFSASKRGEQVLLSWQTATEINNEGFEVEHSTDGYTWKYLGFINGHGNSNEIHNYVFHHQSPASGINYYRLHQLDFDGKSDYSEIRSVKFEGLDSSIHIFPNPATTLSNIQLPGDYEEVVIIVSDLNGRTVFEQRLEGGSPTHTIDVSNWQSGMYLVRVLIDGGGSTTYKLQVIKD